METTKESLELILHSNDELKFASRFGKYRI